MLITFSFVNLSAQYFGKNKPRYTDFAFKIKETPHFDIHYYLDNKEVVNHFSKITEQWYDYHQQIFEDTFKLASPLILYNNHADFQQTNSISGAIGVGTGGVTEGLKNRVVMPLTMSNQQTSQVLGHELVHAFQFHHILGGDSTSLQSLVNLPLWMVEGMAEYITLGNMDPFTSMWMRDAILNNNVPTIEKMANPRYFPYRYGQAMWSFLTNKYGDNVMGPLFRATAVYGVEIAFPLVVRENIENLSLEWITAIENHYEPFLLRSKERPNGRALLSNKNSGRINVCPVLSPNGKYVIYLSERDVFSTDVFLADARNGKPIRKMASLIKDGDLDNFNFLESSGTWSKDSKRFAFVGFKKGKNVLIIKNVENGNTEESIFIPGVPSISNPTWSPDGKEIVFTGLVDGWPDLYAYNLKKSKVRRLTNDPYSEILPSFSSDGSKLAFSYDKRSMIEGRKYGRFTYDIAIMDFERGTIETKELFNTADNLNPIFDSEDNIYFVSDRDGYRNLYFFDVKKDELFQMTKLMTGISGITRYSPMISNSHKKDRILYTHYFNSGYDIYKAKKDDFNLTPVNKNDIDFSAAFLPGKTEREDIVNRNLASIDQYPLIDDSELKDAAYKPKFKLDAVGGGGGIGVGVGNTTFGNYTGLQGGLYMLFSDMLGNHQLFSQVSLNGEILDFGAQVSYLNRTKRLAWGVGLSHIPLRAGYQNYTTETINIVGVDETSLVNNINLIRVFDEGINLFAHYPFSTTLRLEGSIGGSYRSFRWDVYKDYFVQRGGRYVFALQERNKVENLGNELDIDRYYTIVKGFGANVGTALVGDNSYFGLTSPLAGYRYRLGVDQYFGNDKYTSVIADYRKYFWKKPISIAIRGMSYLRFEQEANSVYPFYVGQMGFVRGYGTIFDQDLIEDLGRDFSEVLGSKMLLTNFEIRLPFTGPENLSLIKSKALFSDLALFFDAGVAFDNFSQLSDGRTVFVFDPVTGQTVEEQRDIFIATSAGLSLRVNLFGALILEPYYAIPLVKNGKGVFGLNFIPGW